MPTAPRSHPFILFETSWMIYKSSIITIVTRVQYLGAEGETATSGGIALGGRPPDAALSETVAALAVSVPVGPQYQHAL